MPDLLRKPAARLALAVVAAALLAGAGVRAAAVLVEIDTEAGGIAGDRVRRAEEFVTRAAGAARGIAEGDG